MNSVPVSIVIPVKNEEKNILRCLESIPWADEVFVIDSNSTDKTKAIAEAHGATVVQFNYQPPWPKKKNWALDTINFKNEWVLLLDADEILPQEAAQEIRNITTAPNNPVAAYWVARRFHFLGKPLKHAYFPNWVIRLIKHKQCRFAKLSKSETQSGDQEIHEPMTINGPTGKMKSIMDHYAFPTVSDFIDKHNRYSSWEAHVELAPNKPTNKDTATLGRKLKPLFKAMPFRPLLRFLYVYIWQRGFLDGKAGYYFARLHGEYELMTLIKKYELRGQRDTDND